MSYARLKHYTHGLVNPSNRASSFCRTARGALVLTCAIHEKLRPACRGPGYRGCDLQHMTMRSPKILGLILALRRLDTPADMLPLVQNACWVNCLSPATVQLSHLSGPSKLLDDRPASHTSGARSMEPRYIAKSLRRVVSAPGTFAPVSGI